MVRNKFCDFIVLDPDPDPHLPNFVDPDPHTINADQHDWLTPTIPCVKSACSRLYVETYKQFIPNCFPYMYSQNYIIPVAFLVHFPLDPDPRYEIKEDIEE